jgi:hypothetical protein
MACLAYTLHCAVEAGFGDLHGLARSCTQGRAAVVAGARRLRGAALYLHPSIGNGDASLIVYAYLDWPLLGMGERRSEQQRGQSQDCGS